MKINIKSVLIIAMAAVAPLILTNCIILVKGDISTKEDDLLKLEESRMNGTITQAKYKSMKKEIMKSEEVIP